jgi:hypothetical protein
LPPAARGFKAILRRSVTVRIVEDVDDVVLSAAEAKALVAGDPDVLRRVQLQSQIVKLEALRAAHLDNQVRARWELKRRAGSMAIAVYRGFQVTVRAAAVATVSSRFPLSGRPRFTGIQHYPDT